MRVLGLDPGSLKTGYAIIEEKKSLDYIHSGILDFSKEKNFFYRLMLFKESFQNIIKIYQPDVYCVEGLIFVKSPTSLMKLAQTRGALLSVIPQDKKDFIFEFAPNLVKLLSSGYGLNSKLMVGKIIKAYFQQDQKMSSDESDAIAVALCYFNGGSHELALR